MKKSKLNAAVQKTKNEITDTMQTMYDNLDDRHRKKVEENDTVNKRLKRHGVKRKK